MYCKTYCRNYPGAGITPKYYILHCGHTRDRPEWVRSGVIWINPGNTFTLWHILGVFRCVYMWDLEIMVSDGGHDQDQYTRFLLLVRKQGGISCIRAANSRRMRSQRKAAHIIAMASLLSLFVSELFAVSPRSMWMRQRSSWCKLLGSMTGLKTSVWVGTLWYLCDQLQPVIKKQNTNMRQCVSLELRVAITLLVLATTAQYCTAGRLFGVARNTVSMIVHERCITTVEKLLPKYVQFLSGNGLKEVMDGFKDKWSIPQCAGLFDGLHIPVSPPTMNHTDYYNRKGW